MLDGGWFPSGSAFELVRTISFYALLVLFVRLRPWRWLLSRVQRG